MMSGETTVYTVLEVLIAIICCLGNAPVIWAVWSSCALREPTFCFMLSLAVADFLVGFVAVPFAVLVDGQVSTSFNVCLIISCVVIMLTMASVLSLLAIAVDRYLRVVIPLRYRKTVTERRSWLVVGSCWFFAFLLSSPPILGWNRQEGSPSRNSSINCRFIAVIPGSYMVYFNFFLCTLTPLLVMTVLYFYIFCKIKSNLHGKVRCGSASHIYYQKERNLAQSLVLVLLLFAIGWLPLHLMNCVAYFGNASVLPRMGFHVGILLSHSNSAVNPIVYAFKIPKIQEAFLRIWKSFFVCRDYSQTSQSNPTTEDNTGSQPNIVINK
ncbi:hypothetical protein DPEC_G00208070 [Dallia pectoralis]|uniref:Uncharacterized protein n=1 Tax=Dallia pectoralis TaxID=75939 RepID=A0ACC2G5D3_DALPE|nr:hypothetical protein DPEC_G00208070 [Dallia pectoralis]